MEMRGNKAYRRVLRHLLALQDRISGVSFPKMARVKQVTVFHCGPAVMAMLYSYFGVRVSQRGMVSSLRAQNKIKKYGLNVSDLARASHILGKGAFVFWKKSHSKISDLDLAVNKYKSPVGVEWQGVFYEDADEDDGHYGVITSIDKNKGYLRIADPFYKFAGVDRRFRINDFFKRWWDVNTIGKRNVTDSRVIFVVTPKGESWPKKLGMLKA